MSYETTDQTAQNGAPINLYLITVDGKEFAYTDNPNRVSAMGYTFLPRQIERSAIYSTEIIDDSSGFTVTLPIIDELSVMLTGVQTPLVVKVRVWELHLTDPDAEPRGLHYGLLSAVQKVPNDLCEIVCTQITLPFIVAEIPWPMYSVTCNHTFGDSRCKYNVPATAYDGIVVAGINLWSIELSAPVPNAAEYEGGEVINMRTNAKQDAVSINGTSLFTLGGFTDIKIGDPLRFCKGCDRTLMGGCTTYNNVANFGGFPFVPRKNPFLKGFGEYEIPTIEG